jgi:ATP-binding cassette subfamily B protein/subfamily B ATP-binding cassette protein MsbA
MAKDTKPRPPRAKRLLVMRAWLLMRMQWRPATTGLALSLLAIGASLYQPWPIQIVVDSILTDKAPPPRWLVRYMSDKSVALLVVCCVLLVVYFIRYALNAWGTMYLVRAGLEMTHDLRCRLYEHMQKLSLLFHERHAVGDSIYRVTWDTYSIQTLFNSGVVPMINALATLIGMIFIMWRFDPLLTLLALAVVPALWLTIKYYGERIGRTSTEYHDSESKVSTVIQETLTAIRTVQAFVREEDERRRFEDDTGRSAVANLRLMREQVMVGFVAGLITAAGTVAIVWVGGERALNDKLSVGELIVFITYVGMLYTPMATLSGLATAVQGALGPFRRVVEILTANPVIRDKPRAKPLTDCRGIVRFEHVSFGYEPGRLVLKDVDFEARPGELIALVGPSGSGKSTLLSLLFRFYDPQKGRVLVDGSDVRDYQYQSLRRQISIVPQEPILFSAKIAENIAYGRPDATRDQIIEAAKQAEAHEFITALPDGYDAQIGERGATLSGGQRQRLALARAFLKNSPILILDEPTAALDAETEAAVLRTLRRLRENRTVFVVAHRLSTIRDATTVMVLQAGQVAERGPHDELLAHHGAYAKLVELQFGPAK